MKIKTKKIFIMRHHKQKLDTNGRLIAGIIILVAGVLFMLNNFNILPRNLEYYIFSWKTLLIAIGTLNLLFSHNRTAGFILITVGVAFWIPDIFSLSISAGKFIWPFAIIGVGIFLLFNHKDDQYNLRFWEDKIRGHQRSGSDEDNAGSDGFIQDDYIDEVAIFGGGDRIITSKNFRGGKVTSIFGGSALHLKHAKMAPGKQKLDVFFLFGGSEIIVPADWNVKVEVVSIFGGFSDKRYVRKPEENAENDVSSLTIKGLVLFGGGEIKSY